MSKTLTLAATSLAGLVLGAGIGVAAAGQGTTPDRPERPVAVESMDEMHDSMVEAMPAELAEQHDEMHGAMAGLMGDVDHAAMMGSMGSAMGGMAAGEMPADHDVHHPGRKG
jgi:hypothetical protein